MRYELIVEDFEGKRLTRVIVDNKMDSLLPRINEDYRLETSEADPECESLKGLYRVKRVEHNAVIRKSVDFLVCEASPTARVHIGKIREGFLNGDL